MPIAAPAPDVALAATLAENQEAFRKGAERIVESARETVAQSELPVETLTRAGGAGPEIVRAKPPKA